MSSLLKNAYEASRFVSAVLAQTEPFEKYPPSFLSDFLLPAFSLALPQSEDASLDGLELPPKTLRHLHNQLRSSTVKRTSVLLSFDRLDATCYLNKEPNILEKLCFAACRVDVGVVNFIEAAEEHPLVDEVLRGKLVEDGMHLLSGADATSFATLLKLVPLSMLEGLVAGSFEKPPSLPNCKVVSLEPRVTLDENYAFFVAKARLDGLIILGEPHGAYYFQASEPTAFEVTERGLADIYSAPSWAISTEVIKKVGSFPNARASKNKFIYIRNLLSVPRARARRDGAAIIILPLFSSYRFYCDPSVTIDHWVLQLDKLIAVLKRDNIREIYFKPHPRESEVVLDQLNAFSERADVSYETENIRQSGVNYEEVVFFSPLSTGIIEVAVQRKKFSIFVSGSARVRSDYEKFLLSEALSMKPVTSEDGSRDRLLCFSSKTFLRAYNATWSYSLSWARGIKRAASIR